MPAIFLNLKAGFIYNPGLSRFANFQLYVYGQYFDTERSRHGAVYYEGSFDPEFPDFDRLFNFGLIWEGNSIHTCEGKMGEYILYNSPHKTSLYIALGLPIIVWEKAAIASFVLENNIGFTVGSLEQLNEQLSQIDHGKYKQYVRNVSLLSSKIVSGQFIKKALSALAADALIRFV